MQRGQKPKPKPQADAATKWKPLPYQREFLEAFLNPEVLYLSACVGRQAGKTEVIGRAADKACRTRKGFRVCWGAPNYPQTDVGFRRLLSILRPGSPSYNKCIKENGVKYSVPRRIEYQNGSVIDFRSLDRPDSIRGETYDLVIVDEAREIDDYTWNDCLLPTLAATGGKAVAVSTPGPKNWFYDLWLLGRDEAQPEYASVHGTTLDNIACPSTERFVEHARQTMPADTFRREILAVFLEDDSDVFRGVKDYLYLPNHLENLEQSLQSSEGAYIGERYQPGASYSMGIDVAKIRDWTVILIVRIEHTQDETLKKVVFLDRFRGDNFAIQKQRALRAWKMYGRPKMVVDASGKGDPFIDELKRNPDSIPDYCIEPFTFTRYNKGSLIEALQADIDHGRLSYPRIDVLLNELASYQYKVTANGHVQYSAPEKRNDDCVIALALACHGARQEDEEPELLGAYSAGFLGF